MSSTHDQWLRHLAQRDAQDPNAAELPPLATSRPAPAASGPMPFLDPDFDIGAAIQGTLVPSRRADGWTPARQRAFCDLVATGHTIEGAARAQGLSASSAYGFRNSAKGAAFAIGWIAASLLQRQRLADTVAARAFEGQTVTITRPDGSTHERHFHDNRLAMSVLARLDRLAAGQLAGVPDTTGEGQAARLAAAEFDRYLDVLGEGSNARAGLFLAARVTDAAAPGTPELAALSGLARADLYARTGAGVVAEVAVEDLDASARAAWTAEQWARAEAAGLIALGCVAADTADGTSQLSQHSPDTDNDEPVWFDEYADDWRTSFPPTDDWCGEEEGLPGDEAYARDLTDAELDAIGAPARLTPEEKEEAAAAERDRWFAAAAAEQAAGGAVATGHRTRSDAELQAEDDAQQARAAERPALYCMSDAEHAAYWGLPHPASDGDDADVT